MLPAAAAGSVVIVPPVPNVPLKIIGSGSALIALVTKAVVAICVVFVPAVAVGAVGVPDNAGDAFNA